MSAPDEPTQLVPPLLQGQPLLLALQFQKLLLPLEPLPHQYQVLFAADLIQTDIHTKLKEATDNAVLTLLTISTFWNAALLPTSCRLLVLVK